METLRSLIRGDLPPVGEPIHFSLKNAKHSLPEFSDYIATWVDSGTSALALALLAAKQLRAFVSAPEVIIPGYCCPDLVAAANYAGVKAVVVDISVNDPAYNVSALKLAVNSNTIAIIAVNFLGIREDMEKISSLKIKHPNVFIIEDNAQWFPLQDEMNSLTSDFVVFSFGRGKPVGLLGGGLLLSKHSFTHKISPSPISGFAKWKNHAKYTAYNFLLKPAAYQLLNRNPFMKLGETRYHKLTEISAMDGMTRSLVNLNLQRHWQRNTELENIYDDLFSTSKIHNKFDAFTPLRRRHLLRYPVLFNSLKKKEQVFALLKQAGLGATEMYKLALPDIEGVKDRVSVIGEQKNALFFAHHFITLPLHSGVTLKYVEEIKKIFSV